MTNHHIVTTCQGMPPGYESPCGVILEPHGPHDITAEQATTPTSQDVSLRIDRMALTERDHNFLVGWLTSSAPAAMDDALDAVEAYRDRIETYHAERRAARAAHVPVCMCTGIEHDANCARVAWATQAASPLI